MSDNRLIQYCNIPDHLSNNAKETDGSENRTMEFPYCYGPLWVLEFVTPWELTLEELHYALWWSNCPFYPRHKDGERGGTELSVLQDRFLDTKESLDQTYPVDSSSENCFHRTQQIVAHAKLLRGPNDRFILHGTSDCDWLKWAADHYRLGHEELANICIKYLQSQDISAFVKENPISDDLDVENSRIIMNKAHRRFPFLQYALASLFIHVSAVVRLPSRESVHSRAADWFNRLACLSLVWTYYHDIKKRSLDVKPRDFGVTLLEGLVKHNMHEFVPLEIRIPFADQDPAGRRNLRHALELAANKGYDNILELLLDQVVPVGDVEIVSTTPLHSAAYNGSVRAVMTLLQHGAYASDGKWFKGEKLFEGSALIAAINHPIEASYWFERCWGQGQILITREEPTGIILRCMLP